MKCVIFFLHFLHMIKSVNYLTTLFSIVACVFFMVKKDQILKGAVTLQLFLNPVVICGKQKVEFTTTATSSQ